MKIAFKLSLPPDHLLYSKQPFFIPLGHYKCRPFRIMIIVHNLNKPCLWTQRYSKWSNITRKPKIEYFNTTIENN